MSPLDKVDFVALLLLGLLSLSVLLIDLIPRLRARQLALLLAYCAMLTGIFAFALGAFMGSLLIITPLPIFFVLGIYNVHRRHRLAESNQQERSTLL
jgi:uncharacterized membrane protein